MLLGSPVGQFALGQTADISMAVLTAVEDVDIAIFVGEIAAAEIIGDLHAIETDDDNAAFIGLTGITGDLVAVEPDDEASIVAETVTFGTLNAIEDSDVISFIAEGQPFGVLAATEESDEARFDVLAFHDIMGQLRAVEDEDTVAVRAWAVPFGTCQPKTVCLTGARRKPADLVGSQADSDTATCREWDRAA
jgi:hypothetical protein